MRAILALAVVLCLSATLVQAQAPVVAFYSYVSTDTTCSTTPTSVTPQSLGQCQQSGTFQGAKAYSLYACDGSSANTFYQYTYSDVNCTQLVRASKVDGQCRPFGAAGFGLLGYQRYACANQTGATLPNGGSFPPTGNFAVSTSYQNITTWNANPTPNSCAGATGMVAVNTVASKVGVCSPQYAAASGGTNIIGSYYAGCTPDGTSSGTVYFSDTACGATTGSYVTKINYGPNSCNNGATTTSCPSILGTSWPSSYSGTLGYSYGASQWFGNQACSATTVQPLPTYQAVVLGQCVDSSKTTCSSGNVTQASVQAYTDSTQKGLCTNTFGNPTIYTVGVCQTLGTANPNSFQVLCSYTPPAIAPTSGAASIQASLFAVVAAVVLAMLGSKQL